jgi:hypothetical protein
MRVLSSPAAIIDAIIQSVARRGVEIPSHHGRIRGTFWRAQLQTPAGDFECLVLNLSARGAHIEIDHPLMLNQSVTLILEPLGEFFGTVAWCYNNRAGIQTTEHRTIGTKITPTLRTSLAPMLRELKEALERIESPRT